MISATLPWVFTISSTNELAAFLALSILLRDLMDPLWSTTRLMFMASPTAIGTTCSTVAGYCEPEESVSVTVNWDASRAPGVEPAWSAIFVYRVTCGYAELSTCDTNIVSGLFGSEDVAAGWLDAAGCCTVVVGV